jgi:hypothetical protein
VAVVATLREVAAALVAIAHLLLVKFLVEEPALKMRFIPLLGRHIR